MDTKLQEYHREATQIEHQVKDGIEFFKLFTIVVLIIGLLVVLFDKDFLWGWLSLGLVWGLFYLLIVYGGKKTLIKIQKFRGRHPTLEDFK
jgi:hypothetical protein